MLNSTFINEVYYPQLIREVDGRDFHLYNLMEGLVAKWKGSGLQNRDHGFKSRRRLWQSG